MGRSKFGYVALVCGANACSNSTTINGVELVTSNHMTLAPQPVKTRDGALAVFKTREAARAAALELRWNNQTFGVEAAGRWLKRYERAVDI